MELILAFEIQELHIIIWHRIASLSKIKCFFIVRLITK